MAKTKELPFYENDESIVVEDDYDVTPLQPVSPSAPLEDEVYTVSHNIIEAEALLVQPSAPVEPSSEWTFGDDDRMDNNSDDLLAQEAAAEAREQGVAVIRDHLASYLEQNPEASYVTWIATLHPENAEVSIDPRFLLPGNPWWTVFEEARFAMNGVAATATTRPSGNSAGDTQSQPTTPQQQPVLSPASRYYGGLIPMIVGFSTILTAVSVALTLQLVSMCFYICAITCAQVCRALSARLNICTICCYALPWFLLQLFRSLDFFLLVVDTIAVECTAAVAYMICTPLAISHQVGIFYHQQARRLAHYVRWAFRKPFHGCDPPRVWTFGKANHVVTNAAAVEHRDGLRTETSVSEYHLVVDDDS